MIRTLTGVDEERAEHNFTVSDHSKEALVMEIMNVDKETAEGALINGMDMKRAINI